MKIPSSFRRLVRDFNSASRSNPSWFWLRGNPVDQTLWKRELSSLVYPADSKQLLFLGDQIRVGAQVVSASSSWLPDFLTALLGSHAKPNEHLIIPLHCGKKLVACLGWERDIDTAKDVVRCIPKLRQAFRKAWELEMKRSECQGLHWVLSRSDRPSAVVRPDGTIVATSPTATDLMKSLQFGSRHHCYKGAPELPRRLAESMRAALSGQIKLSERCAVRFERLNSGSSWLPLVGAEFFIESRFVPPPISRLTPTERQVYELIQAGASNREIALHRGTSFSTAKNQVAAIMSKLGVSRRQHLMISGAGLISPTAQLKRPDMNGVTISTR